MEAQQNLFPEPKTLRKKLRQFLLTKPGIKWEKEQLEKQDHECHRCHSSFCSEQVVDQKSYYRMIAKPYPGHAVYHNDTFCVGYIKSSAQGGDNKPSNLILICEKCDKPEVVDIKKTESIEKTQVPDKKPVRGGIVRSKSNVFATPVAGSSSSQPPVGRVDSRRPEITQLLEDLRQTLGVPMLDDTEARNRQYAWILIRKFGKNAQGGFDYDDGVKKVGLIIQALKTNDFWKYRATSFLKLWKHGVEIINSSRDLKGGVINVE